MSKIHELKTWPEFFHEVFMGHKTFEVRYNDRDFKKGDCVILNEYDPKLEVYTGRKMARGISYILKGGEFGINEGYVVLSLS